MRCCHRYPRCAGCQVEDKRFNHAPKNGLRVFVAELAKVLDILRPQNTKKDKEPQLTTLCEDVSLHLYCMHIQFRHQFFIPLLVETAGYNLHLFSHYLSFDIIGIL